MTRSGILINISLMTFFWIPFVLYYTSVYTESNNCNIMQYVQIKKIKLNDNVHVTDTLSCQRRAPITKHMLVTRCHVSAVRKGQYDVIDTLSCQRHAKMATSMCLTRCCVNAVHKSHCTCDWHATVSTPWANDHVVWLISFVSPPCTCCCHAVVSLPCTHWHTVLTRWLVTSQKPDTSLLQLWVTSE